MVGWAVGRSVMVSKMARRYSFHTPIETPVYLLFRERMPVSKPKSTAFKGEAMIQGLFT